jgi:hypothetical protein
MIIIILVVFFTALLLKLHLRAVILKFEDGNWFCVEYKKDFRKKSFNGILKLKKWRWTKSR